MKSSIKRSSNAFIALISMCWTVDKEKKKKNDRERRRKRKREIQMSFHDMV